MLLSKRLDIILEVCELCQDLIGEIGQQLLYFRASVYKNETADLIQGQIDQLRKLVELIPGEMLQEPFDDYKAEQKNWLRSPPGECSFSLRVSRLLQNLTACLEDFKAQQITDQRREQDPRHEFEQSIYQNRHKILSVCRPGTRHWHFFHSL